MAHSNYWKRQVWRAIRVYCHRFPVSASAVALCIGLFVAVAMTQGRHEHWGEALRHWGSVQVLTQIPLNPALQEAWEGFEGPFELWKGEWWRLVISPWHHAAWWHLLMNLLALIQLGPLLEQRCRRWTMIGVFLSSGLISIASEALWGQAAVGISGSICAVFGILVALRPHDAELQRLMPTQFVQFVLLSLVVMIPLTTLDLLPVANTAHFSGLIYGWLIGLTWRANVTIRWLVVAAHVLLVPLVWLAAHPFYLGRYHWYRGTQATELNDRVRHLRTAVDRDPHLIGPWLILSELATQEGDLLQAWHELVDGLAANRASPLLFRRAQRFWQLSQSTPEVAAFRAKLQQTFGDEAPAWAKQFEEDPIQMEDAPSLPWPEKRDLTPLRQRDDFQLLFPQTTQPPPSLRSPPPNPKDPGSAAEGLTL